MKFQPDRPEGTNVIHAVTRTQVSVNGQAHTTSVLVPTDAALAPWAPVDLASLTADHIAEILPFKPELVILGSGPTLRFVHPSILRPLIDAGIGVETMDTPAACRTYNVLTSEGRKVLAALIIHP
ncbi:MAG TPA: Mth938-like domain-containing protein [Candidatus Aquabacterium excrementipullorum]|nr:Mth938-like domain-containing protein [Candidatus Aquabacterium excrementipullorum]